MMQQVISAVGPDSKAQAVHFRTETARHRWMRVRKKRRAYQNRNKKAEKIRDTIEKKIRGGEKKRR